MSKVWKPINFQKTLAFDLELWNLDLVPTQIEKVSHRVEKSDGWRKIGRVIFLTFTWWFQEESDGWCKIGRVMRVVRGDCRPMARLGKSDTHKINNSRVILVFVFADQWPDLEKNDRNNKIYRER